MQPSIDVGNAWGQRRMARLHVRTVGVVGESPMESLARDTAVVVAAVMAPVLVMYLVEELLHLYWCCRALLLQIVTLSKGKSTLKFSQQG